MGQKDFAILPILTQVDPTDEEFDFDIFKDNFERILKNELNKQFPGFEESDEEMEGQTADKKKPKKKKAADEDEDDEVNEDDDFHSQNRDKVWAFFDFFINNIKVFDPLDRDIITQDEEGEDQVINTKAADLK